MGILSWLWSEFLGEPFCLLLNLAPRVISVVVCPARPQLRKLLGPMCFLVLILVLLKWVLGF